MLQVSSRNNESTLWDHINEIRSKIIICLVATLVLSGVAHLFYPYVLDILLKPVAGQKLVFLSVLDPLIFIFKVDLFGGFILASPIISWAVLSFLKPAMQKTSWMRLFLLYIFALVLAIAGLLYAYFLMFPVSLTFLLSITVPGIENVITAKSYISFLLIESLITAVVFQIPLFILTGVRLGIFKVKTIAAKRRHIYLGGVIVLSVLTPTTDLFSLGIIIVPAMIIFEGSLLLTKVITGMSQARRT